MKPKALNLYLDYIENIEALSDEEAGQLLRAILTYANTGEEPEMSAIVKVAFVPIRKQIDVEFANYEAVAKARSEAGKKGANNRWQSNNQDNKDMANDSKGIAKDSKNSKSLENENEYENKNKEKISKKECECYFEKFWNAYPRKVGKAIAFKSFEKLKVNAELLDKMLKAIEVQKKTDQWQDERYIPHPSTWLNQQRWNDEVKISNKQGYIQRDEVNIVGFGTEYIRQ